MKKILLLTLVLFFAVTSFAVAEDLAGKWGINAEIMGLFPSDDDTDETLFYAGSLEYNFTSNLAGEVEIGYAQMDDELESLKFGEASFVPLMVNLKVRYPEGKFNPFIYGGLGVIFADYEEEQWVKDLGVSLDVGTGFAYQIGAGVDIFIADNTALYAKLGYLWSEVESEASVTGYTTTADIELDHFFVGGGIKIVF
ncbi:MAG: porin family protein [Omnitrophica bacterium]|nr:porin family protein [Candidatus Omnitrophota bacterium]